MNKLTKGQLEFIEKNIEGTWVQNVDSSVSIKGDFICAAQGLKSIPVQFKDVSGGFYCFDNKLTSLKWCPETVGDFFCSNNKLTSLKYCPNIIKGDFDCGENQLVTLEYCPDIVPGTFRCENNPVSEETLNLLFQARTIQKLSWEQALASCYSKIPQKDLDIMKIPKDFKEKYRGNIAASNLGLI